MAEVVALQIALASRMDMRSVESVDIADGHGIAGDRYEDARHRQVTVQSLEEIALAEAMQSSRFTSELGSSIGRFGAARFELAIDSNSQVARGSTLRRVDHRCLHGEGVAESDQAGEMAHGQDAVERGVVVARR